jgi:hypothetical protein
VIEDARQVGTTQCQQLPHDHLVERAPSSSRSRSRLQHAVHSAEFDDSDMTSRSSHGWSRSKSRTRSSAVAHPSTPGPITFNNYPFLTELAKVGRLPRRSPRALSSGSRGGSEDAIHTPPDGDDLLLFGSRGRRRSVSSGSGNVEPGVWVPSLSSPRQMGVVGETRSRSRGRAPYKFDHGPRNALDRGEVGAPILRDDPVVFDPLAPILNPTDDLGSTGHTGGRLMLGFGRHVEDL